MGQDNADFAGGQHRRRSLQVWFQAGSSPRRAGADQRPAPYRNPRPHDHGALDTRTGKGPPHFSGTARVETTLRAETRRASSAPQHGHERRLRNWHRRRRHHRPHRHRLIWSTPERSQSWSLIVNGDFTDSALVLVGHGSTLNAESSAPTYQHADELRRRGIFGQVLEAFWKIEPAICAVLRGVFARRVFVVPLFISEGYFTEDVIPRELGLPRKEPSGQYERVCRRGEQTIYYCGPIGTHPSMTAVLLARAREIVQKH